MRLLATRSVNFFAAIVCFAAVAFAYFYLEKTLFLDPCPLCMLDRVVLLALGSVFLIAALHAPLSVGQKVYQLLTLLLGLLGIAIGTRHVWLQHLPADQVPECGPGLGFMMDTLPFAQVLMKILQGSGECAEVQWQLLGLSIPEQTLILFGLLFLLSIWQLRNA